MQRTSLVLISDSYVPVMGGSEIEAQRVAAAMIRGGHKVEVWCAGGPPMPPVGRWTDSAGVPVRILTRRSRRRWKDIVFALGVGWKLWRERRNYQVVYFLMQGLHLATGLCVARCLGKPILVKISGSGIIPLMQNSLAGRLELYWISKWAVRLMVLNEGMIDEAASACIPRDKLCWMPNPVDTSEFRPADLDEVSKWRRSRGIRENAAVVIYVGRLSPEKGLLSLLHGFSLAARQVPELMLLLVGDGPQRAELEAVSSELGLGAAQVRFVGLVDLREVPEWLRGSDIFALLSPNEGFSCALAEAMSAGLASVVTDIPANRQLVDDRDHGFLISYSDHAAAAAAFLTLARDPQLRRRAGEAARKKVSENFSTDRVVERYEALLAEALASGPTDGT